MSSEDDMSDIEPATTTPDSDVLRCELARQIGRLADQLRVTAERIERYSAQLAASNREAAAIAADALNEYEQLNVGPIVWGIVRDLGQTR